jgi:hypothetical protein
MSKESAGPGLRISSPSSTSKEPVAPLSPPRGVHSPGYTPSYPWSFASPTPDTAPKPSRSRRKTPQAKSQRLFAPFLSGPGELPSGPRELPSGPRELPSGPGESPSGPGESPSGLKNFSSGLENFLSGLENFLSGLENFSSGLENFSSGLENFSSGLKGFSSGLGPVCA